MEQLKIDVSAIQKDENYVTASQKAQWGKALQKYCDTQAQTVGEFTGLCDKNGKNIFEGDIISSDNNGKFIIKWNNNKAKFVCGFVNKSEDYFGDYYCNLSDKYIKQTFNVIGNIHDNPELLEVEE
ncbi:MAG: YopX family protein [Clostridia bacterium]